MKKIIFLLAILPQVLLYSQKKLDFDFDYARFRYDSTQDYIEFYYSFPQNELTLNNSSNGYSVKAVLHVELKDSSSGNLAVNKNWEINTAINDTSALAMSRNLVGIIRFVIPKGVYFCHVKGMDGVDSLRSKTINERISVDPFGKGNFSISDIQAASNIKQENADSTSVFYKNTLEVIPNPVMVYGEGLPVLFYYAEIYNLGGPNISDKLNIKTYLVNSKGVTVIGKTKEVSRTSDSRVEVGTLKINKLPTDTYLLLINVIDSLHNFGVSSSKRLFVYNPTVVDSSKFRTANSDLLSSEYSVLNNEECDDLFEKSKYVATTQETKQYKGITNLEGKRQFLFQFWRKRDQDPSTPQNEYKDNYMERVRLANERYSTLNRKGMKTDRGRVLIEYGEPDEIERFPNEVDRKPYEIWHYNQIEGGVVFIFGDVTGFSDYQLLHSTKRGEISDVNWQQRIISN